MKDSQWKMVAHAASGAAIYQANNCGMCHQVNGVGMKTGPPLSRIAMHREKQWVIDHFNDPQKMTPGSTMPPYKLNAQDMENLTHYLLMLP